MARKLSRQAKVERIIRQAMARNGMYEQKDLCPYLKKSASQIGRILTGEAQMTLLCLLSLDGILKFTDEEWMAFRCRN